MSKNYHKYYAIETYLDPNSMLNVKQQLYKTYTLPLKNLFLYFYSWELNVFTIIYLINTIPLRFCQNVWSVQYQKMIISFTAIVVVPFEKNLIDGHPIKCDKDVRHTIDAKLDMFLKSSKMDIQLMKML